MKYINIQHDGFIGTVQLDRPDKHNAFNAEFIQELHDAIVNLNEQPGLRAIVIKSTGKNFSAGADMNWMRSMATFSKEDNFNDAMKLANLFYTLYHSPLPTIALASGWALGGGAGLLCCSDIVLADTSAKVCFSEVKIGIAAATISPFVLNKLGSNATKRYLMTAETLDADTAHRLGLFDEVHPTDHLEQRALDIASQIAKNGPEAVKHSKALVQEFQDINDETKKRTAQLIAALRVSEEGQEGLLAFLEKRAPTWNT